MISRFYYEFLQLSYGWHLALACLAAYVLLAVVGIALLSRE